MTKHLKIAQTIMTTNWNRQHLEWNNAPEGTIASYWKYLEQSITEYGMLWHFVHHQVNTPYNHCYGLFPEKKVRFFCRHFFNLSFDTRRRNPFDEAAKHFGRDRERRNGQDRWLLYYLPNGIPDPEGFCNKLDELYLRFAQYEDSFQAGSLLEFLCLSLLHFAIYNVPVRQCSLCKRYYIPVKNQSAEENFCHRSFKPGGHQSCSSYHSHCNSSPRTKGQRTPAEELESKIKSLRSMLSRSFVMGYPNGFYWVDFLKNCVTFIKRSTKKGQLSIENAQMLIGKLKMIHHIISKQNHCPDIPVPDLYNLRQPDFETIEEMLQDVLSKLENP